MNALTRFRLRFLGPATAFALMGAALSACSTPAQDVASAFPANEPPAPAVAAPTQPSFTQTGLASWYHKTRKMKRTANGEPMSNTDMTAAHRTLPMNTMVRVTNLSNGESIVVRINDRGPFKHGRIIDLSLAAAKQIGMKGGLLNVRVDVFDDDQLNTRTARSGRTSRAPAWASSPG